jgi:polar amino acid transport system permease protein
MTTIIRFLPLFIKGAFLTVQVLVIAAALSFCLGLILGALSAKKIRLPLLSPLAEGISFVFRGIPFFILLLIVYYVFNLEPFAASVIGLGLSSSGYVAQFVRGALNSVPDAQWESAFSLGYTKREALFKVILGQTLRMILPNLSNELDSVLKSTAIISSIGLLEITRVGMNIVSREMNPGEVYLTVALFYLTLSLLINLGTKKWEKKYV